MIRCVKKDDLALIVHCGLNSFCPFKQILSVRPSVTFRYSTVSKWLNTSSATSFKFSEHWKSSAKLPRGRRVDPYGGADYSRAWKTAMFDQHMLQGVETSAHSKSLKLVPFESLGFLFAFYSNYGRIFSRLLLLLLYFYIIIITKRILS